MRPWRPLADNGDAYLLKADIPGVAKDDIEVRNDGRQVTLSAEVKQKQTTPGNGSRKLAIAG